METGDGANGERKRRTRNWENWPLTYRASRYMHGEVVGDEVDARTEDTEARRGATVAVA